MTRPGAPQTAIRPERWPERTPGELSDPRLDPLRRLADELENRFRIPGTPVRFGLDAIIGLIPGAGDVLTAIIGSYALYVGFLLGAPASVLLRMLLNLAIDAMVGAIPVLGDVFDVAWRSTTKNLTLLDRFVADPHQARKESGFVLVATVSVLLLIVAGSIGLALWLASLLLRAAGSLA